MKRFLCLAVPCGVLFFLAFVRAGETPAYKLNERESKILEQTNNERKKKDLPPLKHNPLLSKVARAHSVNQGKHMEMAHKLDGKDPFARMSEAGYQFMRGGENVAYGYPKMPTIEIIRAWMESKGHRENILSKDFTEIGVGAAEGKDGKVYYTQVFGTPRQKR